MFAASSVSELKSLLQCQQHSIYRIYRPLSPRLAQLRASQRWRELASTTRRRQDYEESEMLDEARPYDGKARRLKYKYPLGRIVGKPGRRQREGSERLKTDAMSKPFEVIVLRDVAESKEKKRSDVLDVHQQPAGRSELSAAQIASEVTRKSAEPNQAEVDDSLNALRPENNLVEDAEYNALRHQLSDRYNTKQLSQYLRNSLRLSEVHADSVQIVWEKPVKGAAHLEMTPWKPGRTPIERRTASATIFKKSEIGSIRSNKSKLVQQILLVAWNLKVTSKQQQVGELEVMLEGWQLKYLFDLSVGDAPMYHDLIDSSFLRQVTEVRPYRPHNVMRIIGRRADAESVAEQLARALQDIASTEMKLEALDSLRKKRKVKYRRATLFTQSNLDSVGQQTASIIVTKDNSLFIYSRHQKSINDARRILLSLLDLPAPGSVIVASSAPETLEHQQAKEHHPTWLPENATLDLHLRYRDIALGRNALPSTKTDSTYAVSKSSTETATGIARSDRREHMLRDARVRSLTSQLADCPLVKHFQKPHEIRKSSSGYWRNQDTITTLPWGAHFCRILHPPTTSSNSALRRRASQKGDETRRSEASQSAHDLGVLQRSIPGVSTLLSFFEPTYNLRNESLQPVVKSSRSQILVAQLYPSPWSQGGVESMRLLPRIELRYQFRPNAPAGEPTLFLDNAIANLGEQEVRMPLPESVVDICFSRRTQLGSVNIRLHDDSHIKRFTQTLLQSMEADSGYLIGEPFLKIKMPRGLCDHRSTAGLHPEVEEVEIDYMFDRFEQIQHIDLVPNRDRGILKLLDPQMKEVMDDMLWDNSMLRYREVDAGVVGGRRIELSLHYPPAPGGGKVDVSRPVRTGLGLADLLTRIGAGELKPLDLSSRRHSEGE